MPEPLQEPAARNWKYAHTQGFYDEMSLNNIGTGLCGGQQPTDPRFQVAPLNPTSPNQASAETMRRKCLVYHLLHKVAIHLMYSRQETH